MDNQLGSAMGAIAFTAVLLVLALFHLDRIHTSSPVGKPSIQIAAGR